jgi:anti-sigma regulatory factor (Ser/Thr protein kinase)
MVGNANWSCVETDARDALGARRSVRDFLRAQADASSDLDASELIVGELVSNEIRHAPGPIGLSVTWTEHGATLIVVDRGPGIPTVRCVPDGDSESGRGMLIVQALARSTCIERSSPDGSRVVVELPVRRAASA